MVFSSLLTARSFIVCNEEEVEATSLVAAALGEAVLAALIAFPACCFDCDFFAFFGRLEFDERRSGGDSL